jgi:uncharacterized GH25 family protein
MEEAMNFRAFRKTLTLAGLATTIVFLIGQEVAQQNIKGQVLGGGAPIANSTVTLYAASAAAPKQLAETKTDADGRFEVRSTGAPADSSL